MVNVREAKSSVAIDCITSHVEDPLKRFDQLHVREFLSFTQMVSLLFTGNTKELCPPSTEVTPE